MLKINTNVKVWIENNLDLTEEQFKEISLRSGASKKERDANLKYFRTQKRLIE